MLADPSEMAPQATRVLTRGKTQGAGEVAAGREAMDPSDEAHERRCSDQADTGDGLQALGDRELGGQGLELLVNSADPRFAISDLEAGIGQGLTQRYGQVGGGILEQRPGARDDLLGSDRNGEPEVSQNPANEVESRRSTSRPNEANPCACRQWCRTLARRQR